MSGLPLSEFHETRSLVAQMSRWVDELASLIAPAAITTHQGISRYAYREQTPRVVQIVKAARMVSALNAVIALADAGFTVDGASLLRSVDDFDSEILFLLDGVTSGSLNVSHTQFVADFFSETPRSAEELRAARKPDFVRRGKIDAAIQRLLEPVPGASATKMRDLRALLGAKHNAYVHGAFRESMDLYRPADGGFATRGDTPPSHRVALMENVGLHAYRAAGTLIALAWQEQRGDMMEEIHAAYKAFERSGEYEAIGNR